MFLRKIKISTRLYVMFALLVAALLLIALNGITSRLNQIRDTEFIRENYIDHLEMLGDVNVITGNLFLSYRNYYLEYPDEEKMQVRLDDINYRTNFIVTNLEAYQKALESRNAPQGELENVSKAITKIRNEVVPFNQKLIDLMKSEQIDDVHKLIISKELRALRSTLQDDLITQIYNDCVNNAVSIMNNNIGEMKTDNMFVVISVAIGFLIVVFFSNIIVRSMIIPINSLMKVSDEISNGKVDVNLPVSGNDEVGELTRQFGKISLVLSKLISEMSKMAELHNQGHMDSRIDESGFDGAYKDVVIGINGMVNGYIEHMQEICGVLKEFDAGNFNVEYASLPGDKAILNSVVEELRKNLKDIEGEIQYLSDAAINGQLDVRTKPEQYEGGWQNLLRGLNAVMDAIITPLNESSEVMYAMAAGNLKVKMEGEYKGDFGDIKHSLNSTQDVISSYITEISGVLSEMSEKNMDVSIDRSYIGDFTIIRNSIIRIVDTFNNVLENFNVSAREVANGSKQVADISGNLSMGATEQAGVVEELNASIDQIASQTNKNLETASSVNELVLSVKKNAEIEAEMMKKTLEAMEEINDSSANISRIIKVIDEIAFQTNLLALNAAVEAARAGEHGKGFAVVAEEVRSLAGRSQNAAKDTTVLIESSVQKAAEGARIASETAHGLESIVGQISEVSNLITVISDASKEQSVNIGYISQGIAKVSEVTLSNSSISQETAASAEELSSQAEILRNTVEEFKLKRRK